MTARVREFVSMRRANTKRTLAPVYSVLRSPSQNHYGGVNAL